MQPPPLTFGASYSRDVVDRPTQNCTDLAHFPYTQSARNFFARPHFVRLCNLGARRRGALREGGVSECPYRPLRVIDSLTSRARAPARGASRADFISRRRDRVREVYFARPRAAHHARRAASRLEGASGSSDPQDSDKKWP